MKQALRIFRKDARHLWPQIVLAAILLVAHSILDCLQTPVWSRRGPRIDQLDEVVSVLLTLAWWSLIAACVHEEELPGDRQFWITRPYSWQWLAGAKVMFFLIFVSLLLLVSDFFVLGVQGFPILSNLADLTFRQFAVGSWLILPAFVLATLTRGMGDFVLAWLAVITGIIAESLLVHSSSLEVGVGTAGAIVLLIAAVGTIAWQYSRRQTMAARLTLASVVFIVVPGLSAIPETRESEKGSATAIRADYDLTTSPSASEVSRLGLVPGQTALILPLRISGLPADTALIGGVELAIGEKNVNDPAAGEIRREGQNYFQVIFLDRARLRAIKSHRINLRAKMKLTLVSDRLTIRAPFGQRLIVVPGVGLCDVAGGVQGDPELYCRSAVRSAALVRVWVEYTGFHSEPVESGRVATNPEILPLLSPIQKFVLPLEDPRQGFEGIQAARNHPEAQLYLTVQRPLAELTREIKTSDADLSSYVRPQ